MVNDDVRRCCGSGRDADIAGLPLLTRSGNQRFLIRSPRRRERVADGEPPLALGAAVTNVQVVLGAIGNSSRLEFTVIGDAVNLAAKLEKHIKVEVVGALTTVAAYRLAVEQGFAPNQPIEERPARRIEGVSTPFDLIALA